MFKMDEDNYAFGWRDAFLIASMDYLVDFWKVIGLNFSEEIKSKLQRVARTAYIKYQEQHGRDYLVQRSRIIEETLNFIEFEMGSAVKEELVFWCEHYILVPRQEDYNIGPTYQWQDDLLCLYYRYQAKVTNPNVLGWSEERYTHLAKLIESELDLAWENLGKLFKNLEEHLGILNLNDCQEWDKVIFTEQLNNFGYLGVFCSKLHTIAEHYHFHKFWKLLETEFSLPEIDSLVRWIKNQEGWQSLTASEKYKYIPPALFSIKYLFEEMV